MTDTAQTVEDGPLWPTPEHITDWETEPRRVLPELTPDFDHADFLPEPTVKERLLQVSVMDRLDDTMRNRIKEMFR